MNNEQQNGRPPVPPSKPQIKPKAICRNFIWGTCTKFGQCIFRHELDIGEMRKILKFCHNYQNIGCFEEQCTYLHTTSEEEKLFYTQGQIPRVLLDRYASMSSGVSSQVPPSTLPPQIPQVSMLPSTFMLMPPPPPPPPSKTKRKAAASAPQPVPVAAAPPLPPPVAHPPAGPQHPPLPPSRPPAIPRLPVGTPPIPIGTQPNSTVLYHHQQSQFEFDASRPPPPISLPTAMKRRSAGDNFEGAPCKLRKSDVPKPEEYCENCSHLQQRVDLYRTEMAKLNSDEEYLNLVCKRKQEEYEMGKSIIRSRVNADMSRFCEEYIEGTPQRTSRDSSQGSLGSGRSIIPKQLLIHLLELFLSESQGAVDEALSSIHLDRWIGTNNSSVMNFTPSLNLHQVIEELLINSGSSEVRPSEPSSERASTSAIPNGSGAVRPSTRALPAPPTVAVPLYHPSIPPPMPTARPYTPQVMPPTSAAPVSMPMSSTCNEYPGPSRPPYYPPYT